MTKGYLLRTNRWPPGATDCRLSPWRTSRGAATAGPIRRRSEEERGDRLRGGGGGLAAFRHPGQEGTDLQLEDGPDAAQLRERVPMLVDPKVHPGILLLMMDQQRG